MGFIVTTLMSRYTMLRYQFLAFSSINQKNKTSCEYSKGTDNLCAKMALASFSIREIIESHCRSNRKCACPFLVLLRFGWILMKRVQGLETNGIT